MFLDRGGDRHLVVVDLRDDRGDLLDGGDRAVGVCLDRFDAFGDVLGRARGLLRQVYDLVRDDGEAFAGFAGPGGFDGGVEGEQVGLFSDAGDDLDDVADFRGGLASDVVDSITRRAGAYGFLGSVKDLSGAGEPDFALDFLINGLGGWRLGISIEEFRVLQRLCHAWDAVDLVEDLDALVLRDSSTDLQS